MSGLGHGRRRLYRQPHGVGTARRGRGRRGARPAFDRLRLGGARPRRSSSSATSATARWSARSSASTQVDAIIHFAGSIVVPESVADPLGYYENNTCKTRALIEAAVREQGAAFHLLLDRRRLWQRPASSRCARTRRSTPESPYGLSKLMTRMDAARRGRRARLRLHGAALFQRRRRRSAAAAPASRRRAPRI